MKAEWTNTDSLTFGERTKAVLVIDMPRSCAECTLRTSLEANYLYCVATLPRLKIDPMTANYIKEHKCPLKPLPDPKNGTVKTYYYAEPENIWYELTDYSRGWDDCLAEITRETE